MEILGIGLPEMAFVLLIALILLGPKEMVETSRTVGRALRKFITSPTWQAMRTTGKELQQLPTKLMREAGLEELDQMGREVQGLNRDFTKATRIDPRIALPSFDEKSVFDAPTPPTPPPAKPVATPSPAAPAEPPADSTPGTPQL